VPHLLSPLAQLIRRHWPLLALALAGCDLTGQYDKKFQETMQTSGQRAVFDVNLHSTYSEVVDAGRQNVGVKLRLPKVFDGESKSVAAKADASLPGLSYSLVRSLDDAEGKSLPFAVMFATKSKADQKPEAYQAAVAQSIAGRVPGAKWEDVAVTAPSGTSLQLKRLRADSPQSFSAEQLKSGAKVEGRFDVYYIEAPSHNVFIGWLFPKSLGEKHQLEQAIEAAMGTLEIAGAPAADPNTQAAPANPAPSS
jgi:hypothetical protein